MLDRLVKISSLSGAFLIFCGVLKLIVFYNYFNVSIVDFLNLSEIITSFLDDINLLIIFGLLMTFQSLIAFHYMKNKSRLRWERFVEEYLKVIYQAKRKYSIIFSILIALILSIIILHIMMVNYFLIYLFAFSIVQLAAFLSITKTNEKIEMSDASFAFSIIITILSVVILLAYRDIQIKETGIEATIINISDSTIICDIAHKNIFLGKTEDHIFIYDNEKHYCNVIPASTVKSYIFY